MKDILEREIIAEKIISTEYLKVADKLIDLLESYKGKKVFKVNGHKTQAFTELLAPIQEELGGHKGNRTSDNGYTIRPRIYFELIHKSLYINLNYWVTFGKDDGKYYEMQSYIGKLEDFQHLTETNRDFSKFFKALQISYQQVKSVKTQIETLKDQIKILEKNIPYYAL